MIPTYLIGFAFTFVIWALVLLLRRPLAHHLENNSTEKYVDGEEVYGILVVVSIVVTVLGGIITALLCIDAKEFAWLPLTAPWALVSAWLASYFVPKDFI